MKDTPIQLQSARRYLLELGGAIALYGLVLIPVVRWIGQNPDSSGRWVVGLLPLIPILLAGAAVVRFFARMDELARRKVTEALAFAFAASALAVLFLGCLEIAGLAPLSAWWVWVAMGSFWLLGSAVTALRYR